MSFYYFLRIYSSKLVFVNILYMYYFVEEIGHGEFWRM